MIQTEKRVDFIQACKELGVWSDELNSLILTELKKIRIPLGQILVNRGVATLGSITKALDDFLSKIEAAPGLESQTPTKSPTQLEGSGAVG